MTLDARCVHSLRMSLIFTDFHYRNYIVAVAVHFFVAFWKCCTLAQLYRNKCLQYQGVKNFTLVTRHLASYVIKFCHAQKCSPPFQNNFYHSTSKIFLYPSPCSKKCFATPPQKATSFAGSKNILFRLFAATLFTQRTLDCTFDQGPCNYNLNAYVGYSGGGPFTAGT